MKLGVVPDSTVYQNVIMFSMVPEKPMCWVPECLSKPVGAILLFICGYVLGKPFFNKTFNFFYC